VMPPMATSLAKRKWSDVFEEKEVYDKQSIMDLCASKLRYVNPARPPRRRTEVPLLRNVLIVNTMKHLSVEMKTENSMDYSTEDLSVDPGHFEGLPPLSELLTDIMLDPQPNDQPANTFGWTSPGCSSYSSLTPLEPSISSYMDTSDAGIVDEGKVVHDLLPCTSVMDVEPMHQSQTWRNSHQSSSWRVPSNPDQTMPWDSSNDLDCFLSSASLQQTSTDTLEALVSDLAFQPSNGPLPSFSSFFESSHNSSFTELLQTSPSHSTSSACTSSPHASFPSMNSTSTEDLVGNVNLTESELELLAMTFSSKLPLSFEDLVYALPQTSLLQQTSQPSHTFYVPSSLQSSVVSNCDTTSSSINQCASCCRKDQPPSSVEDNGLVRVLVNL
jgi:hypothetical protein